MHGKRVGVSHPVFLPLTQVEREASLGTIFEGRKAPLEVRNPSQGSLRSQHGKTFTHTPDRAIPGPFSAFSFTLAPPVSLDTIWWK